MLQLETALESPLYDSLRNDFVGINSSDAISLGWNFAMVTVKKRWSFARTSLRQRRCFAMITVLVFCNDNSDNVLFSVPFLLRSTRPIT